jgi:cellulose synthase/poly-beta-1,6-N-acetylglucosamine synthase-like glycosyltransferase
MLEYVEAAAALFTTFFLAVLLMQYAVLLARRGRKEEGGFFPAMTVIVPAHNEARNLKGTLDSITGNGYPGEMEVIAVDDGSTDGTPDVLKAYDGKVRVVRTEHVGKSAAMNTALGLASHPVVVTVDGDTLVGKGSLERLVSPLRDPDVAAASGSVRVRRPRGLLGMFQRIEYLQISLFRSLCSRVGGMIYTAGTLTAFRRSDLPAEGFSGDMLLEDVDLACRLLSRGRKVVFVDNAPSSTAVPDTVPKLVRQRRRWTKGGIQVLKRHRSLGRRNRGAGLFTLPIMGYWYFHALFIGTAILLQMALGYYTYFVYWGNGLSWDAGTFFLGWLSLYGIANLAWQMLAGNYPVTYLSVLNVAVVGMVYGLLLYSFWWFRERPTPRDAVALFFMMPYWLLVMAVQLLSNAGWFRSGGRNWWEK